MKQQRAQGRGVVAPSGPIVAIGFRLAAFSRIMLSMSFMHQRLLAPFRTLGWRLTLSYTLVTVAALLVVETLALLALMALLQSSSLLTRLGADIILPNAAHAAPFLQSSPPDIEGLDRWLTNVAVGGFIVPSGAGDARMTLGLLTGDSMQLAVVDREGRLLSSFPRLATLALPLEQQAVLETALQGVRDPIHLVATDAQRRMFIAAPIQSGDGAVLGALAYFGTQADLRSDAFSQVPSIILGSALVFTIAAGAVGTVFGLWTARGLVRRLRAIAQAADTWSRGDFSAVIPDRSQDELGRLAMQLNRMSEQLQMQLQTRRELASLEERNRLARDLHDSVKQQLFATSMQLAAARRLLTDDPAAAAERLREAEHLAQQTQQELTGLIHELRPAALEGRGLVPALRETLAAWSQQNHIAYDLRVQGERRLPLLSEQALYRVIQEALSNVARHSGADGVALHLLWQDDQLQVTIEDNGHGLLPAAQPGLGLTTMRERVETLGGSFALSSSSSGLRLVIVCPG